MTTRELAELVQKMRVAQKVYFRTRSTADLAASKQLERDVDRAVSDALAPPSWFSVIIEDQVAS